MKKNERFIVMPTKLEIRQQLEKKLMKRRQLIALSVFVMMVSVTLVIMVAMS